MRSLFFFNNVELNYIINIMDFAKLVYSITLLFKLFDSHSKS